MSAVADDDPSSLSGCRVVTTRDSTGRLEELLAAAGADVLHVPLIRIEEPADEGRALAAALESIREYDWLLVTSRHGAARVGRAARTCAIRTAAVGTATAAELVALTGRRVDLVPDRQTAAALVDAFDATIPRGTSARILLAQADRAEPALVDGLRALGHRVDAVTAYATRLRRPNADEMTAMLEADAVAFASGSAALAWAEAVGTTTPPVVCTIGPTTTRAARSVGIDVTAVATDHSVDGLVECLVDALARRP